MRYIVHTPGPPLSGYVAYLWSLIDAPSHAKERIVASGTQELVINLDEDEFRIYGADDTRRCRRFSGGIVSGAYRGFFVIDTRAHTSVVGVHFKPGGALPFLGTTPGTLADTHVELETLWGNPARELRERLCAAVTVAHRFRILEEVLRARLHRPFMSHPAVQAALGRLPRAGSRVGEVASEVGLSRRRFINVFTAEVGMTPKLFSRVQRFQYAWTLSKRYASPDWAQLALECGYFDQSHMIRDFVAFSGYSPAKILRRDGPRLKENHVAVF